MSDLRRKVSYLSGLAERYDLREASREGKILSEVIHVLREVALDVDEVAQNQREIEEYVEELDNDLLCLEETVFEETEDASDLGGEDEDRGVDDDEADGEAYIELECPRCDQPAYFAEHLFDQAGMELSCPHCGYIVFDESADRLVTEDVRDESSLSDREPRRPATE